MHFCACSDQGIYTRDKITNNRRFSQGYADFQYDETLFFV
ncbi:MAG: hypothetical protein ACI9E1_000502 [Cryomorphaceae bacterium]|jgi:hypothetical protein